MTLAVATKFCALVGTGLALAGATRYLIDDRISQQVIPVASQLTAVQKQVDADEKAHKDQLDRLHDDQRHIMDKLDTLIETVGRIEGRKH